MTPPSGSVTASGRPQLRAASRKAAARSGIEAATQISLCPMRYSSSAARQSGLIGTTETPSAFSARKWNRNSGRLRSSSPARCPWP